MQPLQGFSWSTESDLWPASCSDSSDTSSAKPDSDYSQISSVDQSPIVSSLSSHFDNSYCSSPVPSGSFHHTTTLATPTAAVCEPVTPPASVSSICYVSSSNPPLNAVRTLASIDTLYRDGTVCDPHTKRFKIRREWLARPLKHSSNSLRGNIYLYIYLKTSYAPSVFHAGIRSRDFTGFSCRHILHFLL